MWVRVRVRVSCRVRFSVRVSVTVRVSVRVIQVAILSCNCEATQQRRKCKHRFEIEAVKPLRVRH